MTAAIDIITRAMRRAGIIGVGETPAAEETDDALDVLNEILEQWTLDGLMIYRSQEIIHPLTGASSYTIGEGGDIDAVRPVGIEGAFVRLGGLDVPVQVVSDVKFNSVCLKGIKGRPEFLRYDASMPAGRIDLWPVPDSGYDLHLIIGQPFTPVEHSADELILPTGYSRALRLTLAVDLCGEFERPVPIDLAQLAIDARAAIMRQNINNQPVEAAFDTALTGRWYSNFKAG